MSQYLTENEYYGPNARELHSLRRDNHRMVAALTEVQTRCTELLEELRVATAIAHVSHDKGVVEGRQREREAIVAWMFSRKNWHERMGDVACDVRSGAHEVSDD